MFIVGVELISHVDFQELSGVSPSGVINPTEQSERTALLEAASKSRL